MMLLTREVTKAECPWLNTDLADGTEIFRYYGYTYGCVGPLGVPVTLVPNATPFFEVPRDAVGWVDA